MTEKTDLLLEALEILATRVPVTNPSFAPDVQTGLGTLFKNAAQTAAQDKKIASSIVEKLGTIADIPQVKTLSESAIGALSLVGVDAADSDTRKQAVTALARLFNNQDESNRTVATAAVKAIATAHPDAWWQTLEETFLKTASRHDDRFVKELREGVRTALWGESQKTLATLLPQI